MFLSLGSFPSKIRMMIMRWILTDWCQNQRRKQMWSAWSHAWYTVGTQWKSIVITECWRGKPGWALAGRKPAGLRKTLYSPCWVLVNTEKQCWFMSLNSDCMRHRQCSYSLEFLGSMDHIFIVNRAISLQLCQRAGCPGETQPTGLQSRGKAHTTQALSVVKEQGIFLFV